MMFPFILIFSYGFCRSRLKKSQFLYFDFLKKLNVWHNGHWKHPISVSLLPHGVEESQKASHFIEQLTPLSIEFSTTILSNFLFTFEVSLLRNYDRVSKCGFYQTKAKRGLLEFTWGRTHPPDLNFIRHYTLNAFKHSQGLKAW